MLRLASLIQLVSIFVCLVKLILLKKKSYRMQCCPVKALDLMTQNRMRIRVCQHNIKAQQDCKQVMQRAVAIFKKKIVIWKKTSDFKTISFEKFILCEIVASKPDFAAREQ